WAARGTVAIRDPAVDAPVPLPNPPQRSFRWGRDLPPAASALGNSPIHGRTSTGTAAP
ncbi:MAG: hypothetical protein AVDCRST_MAG19-973, partial [uncultured Thermomicrobiales bacterium]